MNRVSTHRINFDPLPGSNDRNRGVLRSIQNASVPRSRLATCSKTCLSESHREKFSSRLLQKYQSREAGRDMQCELSYFLRCLINSKALHVPTTSRFVYIWQENVCVALMPTTQRLHALSDSYGTIGLETSYEMVAYPYNLNTLRFFSDAILILKIEVMFTSMGNPSKWKLIYVPMQAYLEPAEKMPLVHVSISSQGEVTLLTQ